MTVSSTTTKVSYAGNGSTTAFSAPFYFILSSDLKVTLRSATGTETVKTLTTNYTVSGAGVSSGGTVTMLVAPASGETLVIQRNVPLTQEVDYQANDPFPANTHEQALDKLTMETQQLSEALARSIKLSTTNTIASTEITVDAATRANKVLGFDPSGELSATQAVGTYRSTWTTATDYSARDIVKDPTSASVYFCMTPHTSTGSLPISTNAGASYWSLLIDASAIAAALPTVVTGQTDATGAAKIATGTTAQRPTPATGYFRFNTTTLSFEGYNGSAWGSVGGGATGGIGNAAFYENDTTISVDYTLTTNKNAMTAGPVTINNGITVTVPSGQTWSIV